MKRLSCPHLEMLLQVDAGNQAESAPLSETGFTAAPQTEEVLKTKRLKKNPSRGADDEEGGRENEKGTPLP